MFKTFLIAELRYTLKQPIVYVFFIVFTILEFFATVSDRVQIGATVGNFNQNSPFTLSQHVLTLCLLSLVMAVTFFNNAALRDFKYNFNEIMFSSPLQRHGYFFGRFFGALVIATLPLLGVFAGLILGTYLNSIFNWLDPNRFGPLTFEMFVNNYLVFILPNMFFSGTVIYALATKWKSTMISFLGCLLIIIAYIIAGALSSDISNETLSGMIDMLGINTYAIESKYLTATEKNNLSPNFSGLLLQNRILWFVVGWCILLWSYWVFSISRKQKRVKKVKNSRAVKPTITSKPVVNPVFTKNTSWIQFKSFFQTNFLSTVQSSTFKILFFFCLCILIASLVGGYDNYGLKSYPLTYKIIDAIKGANNLFLIVVIIFFSGELIWRDRDSNINGVMDATPHFSLISMTAKVLSLWFTVIIFNLFFILVGIIYQLIHRHNNIELEVYLLDFFYNNLPLFLTFSAISISVQILTNSKYLGYFISILILFVFESVLQILDIKTMMLKIVNGPLLQYSDMDGFGPGLKSALWYNTYWILFSLMALLFSSMLWNRGVKSGLLRRMKAAKKERPKYHFGILLACTGLWMTVAAVIYYNTQIRNPYISDADEKKLAAAYEMKYAPIKNVALPKVTNIKYYIDVFPAERNVNFRATLELTNTNTYPIDSLHFHTLDGWNSQLEISNASLVNQDEQYNYFGYKLHAPLQPGENMEIHIKSVFVTQGFSNDRGNTNIINNGSFFNNRELLPIMGYDWNKELKNQNERSKHGLPAKRVMPKLTKTSGKSHITNLLSDMHADFIAVETVISTSKDQVGIAPGTLIKKWEENNRIYYKYKMDVPSLNFHSFMSAAYEVRKRHWNGIDLEVYYDKKHGVNVGTMLDAMQASLDYYTKNFGPYYHKQARIIEFPRYKGFAMAFAGTMPYSEALGFITNLEDSSGNNVVDYVVAHEMAHQWWGHQVIGANMQGARMMTESFADYSSLMTLKSKAKNPMQMRKFLTYNHDGYLRGRSRERNKELPLYKTETQGYIHYGKGSLVLYALQDYIGEDKLNSALKGFLEEYRYQGPPYPSSHDFLRHLEPQVPDSLKYLIDDGFKEITLYDNRLKKATYRKLNNGKYEVTLAISSTKLKSDGNGNETKVPINDWFDVGFFMDDKEERLYHEQRLKFDKDTTTLVFLLDSLPKKAAIDPRHLHIDRVYSDNIQPIYLEP